MKIWSLLPSSTEILYALDLGDHVTGVTHECDYPPDAKSKPVVTFSNVDSSVPGADIDRQVVEQMRAGSQLYHIVEERLQNDPPDLIVTQDLCPVCAVSPSDFEGHMKDAGCDAEVVCLNPHLLEGVIEDVITVGRATGREAKAESCASSLRERIEALRVATSGASRRRVLTLEWLDPPMPGGHWVPQMVKIAGGVSEPIRPGEASRKVPWNELRSYEPEVVVLMPCGFGEERTAIEAEALGKLEGWPDLPAVRSGEVYAVDANHFFSRPSPRLVEGVEIMARILHPDRWNKPLAGPVLKLVAAPMGRWSPRFEAIA